MIPTPMMEFAAVPREDMTACRMLSQLREMPAISWLDTWNRSRRLVSIALKSST